MTTVTPFTPPANAPFQFQATLLGPTANVTSTGTTFNISVPWNVSGQRFYLLITDQGGNLVLNTPLIASPPGYEFNLVAGWFSESSLVFLEATSQFEVTP
jgi:hypothetical protein